jgi:hypothetical protein
MTFLVSSCAFTVFPTFSACGAVRAILPAFALASVATACSSFTISKNQVVTQGMKSPATGVGPHVGPAGSACAELATRYAIDAMPKICDQSRSSVTYDSITVSSTVYLIA